MDKNKELQCIAVIFSNLIRSYPLTIYLRVLLLQISVNPAKNVAVPQIKEGPTYARVTGSTASLRL